MLEKQVFPLACGHYRTAWLLPGGRLVEQQRQEALQTVCSACKEQQNAKTSNDR